jgi:hypothetical protein
MRQCRGGIAACAALHGQGRSSALHTEQSEEDDGAESVSAHPRVVVSAEGGGGEHGLSGAAERIGGGKRTSRRCNKGGGAAQSG